MIMLLAVGGVIFALLWAMLPEQTKELPEAGSVESIENWGKPSMPRRELRQLSSDTHRSVSLREAASNGELAASRADGDRMFGGADIIPDEYVLMFFSRQDRLAFEQLAAEYGAEILDRINGSHALRIRLRDRSALARLMEDAPLPVAYAPNRRAQVPPLTPPQGLEAPQEAYRAFGANALEWLGLDDVVSDGGQGIVVAVVDTGIAGGVGLATAGQWRAPSLSGETGMHGSAVAAIIAGRDGVAPASALLDIKAMGSDGRGDSFSVARGIVEATDLGADVINLSLGTSGDCPVLRAAVTYAQERGVLLVASTGNEGINRVSYPAAYDGVLGVGAIDAEGRHLYFSNRGESVDLVAPGAAVDVTLTGDEIVPFSGTSAAAPFVTGVAALLKQQHPDWDGEDLANALIAQSDDLAAPGKDDLTGAGALNAARVLDDAEVVRVDLGLMSPWVVSGDQSRGIEIAAQNRGNVRVDQARMRIRTDHTEEVVAFESIGVGATVSHLLRVPRENESVVLEVEIAPVGVTDVQPQNNGYRGVLRF